MKLLNRFFCLWILLSVGCQPDSKPQNQKNDHELILMAAREIILASGKCALITLDERGLPQVRTMDPFEPESDFTIWLATNPKSRKVNQIRNNPNVTLFYADKNDNGYVSIYGTAELVNDQKEKNKRWKEEWKGFYPNREEAYLLIKVIPFRMEFINYKAGHAGDSITWQPEIVLFNN